MPSDFVKALIPFVITNNTELFFIVLYMINEV